MITSFLPAMAPLAPITDSSYIATLHSTETHREVSSAARLVANVVLRQPANAW